MSLCHPWYFEMSCQWCKLFSNASENVIWAKIADKNSTHGERHKKHSDLEKFKGLKENMYAKSWREINRAPGSCGMVQDDGSIQSSTNAGPM